MGNGHRRSDGVTEGSSAFWILILTVGALGFQVLVPGLAWAPIVIGLALLAVKTRGRLGQFRPGASGALVLVFTASGALGAAIAFDASVAWPRFWTLCGGAVLYFVLSRQPASNTAMITGLGSLAAALLGVLLVATTGQTNQGVDFPSLTQLVRGVPFQGGGSLAIPPNQAGGVVALLLPLSAADFLLSLRRERGRSGWFSGILLAIAAAGLLMSSSRGAWVALGVGGLVGLLTWIMGRARHRDSWVLSVPILGAVGGAVGVWWILYTIPGLPLLVDSFLPGIPDASSRMTLAHQAAWLVSAFPWTGAGLGAFGGLYSRYVLLIPQFYFGYAHNLFLDVLVAQGPIGLLSLLAILAMAAVGAIKAIRPNSIGHDGLLEPTLLAGLTVMILHGLVDSPTYAGGGIALIFLYPALAKAWGGRHVAEANRQAGRFTRTSLRRSAGVGGLILALSVLVVARSWDSIRGSVLSDLVSLQMARVELAGWPNGDVLLNKTFQEDEVIKEGLQRSLALDPRNPSALYRLGLLAMRHSDFESAVSDLSAAHSLEPDHRGITKALGYAYLWAGDPADAERTLGGIPEARFELELYSNWWLEQGDPGLSRRTIDYVNLTSAQPSTTTPSTP